jgi:hypothetical protein
MGEIKLAAPIDFFLQAGSRTAFHPERTGIAVY